MKTHHHTEESLGEIYRFRQRKEYNWEEKSARSHTNQSEFSGRFPASRQGKEKEDARFSMSIYLTIVL
ncbi:uncharacterized protein METZ01_LOCUS140450 [marine metagenome]|uniref:Uncharacterized protein n=1 Tax=marine metagenome TaxID=408172 RepID=A0A381ZEA8_9ZZZZ